MPQTKEADLLVQNKALYEDKEQLSQVNNGAFYISQPKVTHSARFFPSCLTGILGFCILVIQLLSVPHSSQVLRLRETIAASFTLINECPWYIKNI